MDTTQFFLLARTRLASDDGGFCYDSGFVSSLLYPGVDWLLIRISTPAVSNREAVGEMGWVADLWASGDAATCGSSTTGIRAWLKSLV
ncbi:hypothetical protein V6N11_021810 [Hibiscus sabdariffa]|uniref:Uncharacterized protein n=1 Tax=Hibiscus sabdariffa TaxID=183260 RepID=A0ABR2THC6_9ROSI